MGSYYILMVILYFFIGFITATIAAAPPGAANLVVIHTTTKQTLRKAFLVALGAGMGEVLLSLLALHCTMNFADYFQQNPWVQITVFLLFVSFGVYFLLRNKFRRTLKKKQSKSIKAPKFITGLFLAIVNPPVLIFWVLAFSVIQKYLLEVAEMSPWLILMLFFAGVYTGKVITLYVYGKWAAKLGAKQQGSSFNKDVFVGLAFMLIGVFQGVRFFIG